MEQVNIKINGHEMPARSGATILEASRESFLKDIFDLKIPTLYYLKNVQDYDNSGVCVVEVSGVEGLVNASTTKVEEGMEILTDSPAVLAEQTRVVKDILSRHDQDCRHCFRTGSCELQSLVRFLHVKKDAAPLNKIPVDNTSIIIRDQNKCIKCGRCVAMCSQIQGIGAIENNGEGLDAVIGPKFGIALSKTNCINCGQCVAVCPVGALRERDDTDAIMEAIRNPEKYVVVETAPSVRVGLGDAFEYPIGSEVEGKMVAALRKLGFDRVFDTKLGADLTVMEEANELIDRLQNGGVMPLFTSCCPAWIKYCETFFPEYIDNLSSCKSPQQMFGAIVKTYLAQKEGLSKENIIVVSIMPCTAKKFELTREYQYASGYSDVDYSITTRELADLIERNGILFSSLPDENFDEPLGMGSGAGVIFGASGGVMEAALRTAADWIANQDMPELTYTDVRGVSGIKEASYTISGRNIRLAVVSGIENAKRLLHQIKNKEVEYDFIEVMACPGGCVNGGGQIQVSSEMSFNKDAKTERALSLYDKDEKTDVRKAHHNPAVQEIYASFLESPGSKLAHEILHTAYRARLNSRRIPKVIIDSTQCQGCKSCYQTCMYGVYRWDYKEKLPVAAYDEECVTCRQCEMYCPAGCITIIPPDIPMYDALYDPFGLND